MIRRLLVVAWTLAAVGCSPRQYFAQPANVEETRDMVRSLQEEQRALRERLAALESKLDEQGEALNRNRADMNAQLETMAENLRRISDRLDDLSGQMERRAGRAIPPPTLYPTPVNPAVEPVPEDGGEGAEAPPPEVPAPGDSLHVDPEQLYDQAYRDVTRGSYAMAVTGFREFLRLFPDHVLSDNAQYWLGECFYVQDDVTSAMTEFQKVLDNYPAGDKVPAAYLKLGYCQLRLNDKSGARQSFNDLVQKYPTSEEARQAKAKLATLN
jgi:tol-pal system protein YbgF